MIDIPYNPDADAALEQLKTGEANFVILSVETDPTVHIALDTHGTAATFTDLAGKVKPDAPRFVFYTHPDGRRAPSMVLVYVCPPTAPVKSRMVHSGFLQLMVHVLKTRRGYHIVKKFEVENMTDVDGREVDELLA
ncbi:uncharacterized protein EV422DRAFT_524856 [Fimicolochytrium jonesii]|uniref:uncharacterized protein n=1 Tax=Fimicolochytrium jonesii TaxID=1396493 RepID=UPI0022FECEC0|nr:uncharacterized protein EV422DRAFT_524856 [Fimicolochytrium jonesii]KAI8822649.1 hypothetical protein EV422DRAFT_524856 [Fimicolochytrium jonesii]